MAEILAEGPLSAQQRSQVEMLQRAGNRMVALVNELVGAASPRPLPSGAGSTSEPPLSLVGLRLLVVDDSEECQAVVQQYLAPTGARLTCVTTCQAAHDAIAREAFDLVLVDLRLPDGSGLDFVRALRAREAGSDAPPLPVVALSADVLPATVSRALAAGCSSHLAKPVSRRALVQALLACWQPGGRLPGPRLRATFLRHRASEMASAGAAVDRGDFEHLATVGHKLQGSAASYGFPGMSALGRRIEAAAGANEAGALRALLAELASAVSHATGVGPRVPRAKTLPGMETGSPSRVRGNPRGR
jgi:CheY-like chemotaxis protein